MKINIEVDYTPLQTLMANIINDCKNKGFLTYVVKNTIEVYYKDNYAEIVFDYKLKELNEDNTAIFGIMFKITNFTNDNFAKEIHEIVVSHLCDTKRYPFLL